MKNILFTRMHQSGGRPRPPHLSAERFSLENSANQNYEFPKYAFELISHEGSDFIIDLEKKYKCFTMVMFSFLSSGRTLWQTTSVDAILLRRIK